MSTRSRQLPAMLPIGGISNDGGRGEARDLLGPPTGREASGDDPFVMPTKPHQARWRTPEFIFYLVVVVWCHLAGAYLILNVSNGTNPRLHRHLQDGWMWGRKVDVTDGQYRFFRNELPLLALAACTFLLLSHAVRRVTSNSFRARIAFYCLFSFGFLLFVNGSATAFILAIVSINYAISSLGTYDRWRRVATIATWVFNCAVLLANERYRGYRWPDLLGTGVPGGSQFYLVLWLETHRGLFPWHGLFNMVVLRMISFNIDRAWSSESRPVTQRDGQILTFEKHARTCSQCDIKGKDGACTWWREKAHHPAAAYSPAAYFAYLFYVPLHFAGPTMTFNSFVSHVHAPQQSYSPRGVLQYAIVKVALIFLLLEWWLHHFYIFAFTSGAVFLTLSPYEMALVSYFTLIAIWLKFTAIWRFFRLWALADGVEPPENMQRCVSNNYSIQSFWRTWHRSFNRWLVRYIYVPLGGGGGGNGALTAAASRLLPSSVLVVARQSFNVFITFSFVAFWHDRTMQLLAWGWLIALLFVPELSATALFNLRQLRHIKSKWYWRHIRATGAALNIFGMMAANLIGYSVGLDGTNSLLHTISNDGGISMLVVIFTTFFSGAMIMFECRETGITVE